MSLPHDRANARPRHSAERGQAPSRGMPTRAVEGNTYDVLPSQYGRALEQGPGRREGNTRHSPKPDARGSHARPPENRVGVPDGAATAASAVRTTLAGGRSAVLAGLGSPSLSHVPCRARGCAHCADRESGSSSCAQGSHGSATKRTRACVGWLRCSGRWLASSGESVIGRCRRHGSRTSASAVHGCDPSAPPPTTQSHLHRALPQSAPMKAASYCSRRVRWYPGARRSSRQLLRVQPV